MQAITVLRLLSDNIEDRVDELRALSVMALGPIVSGTGLAEDEIVGAEDLAVGTGSDRIHGSGLQIHEDGAWDVPAAGCLIEIDIDPLQLSVGLGAIALVPAGGIDAVLVADHLPKFGADLVAALTALDMQDFSHVSSLFLCMSEGVCVVLLMERGEERNE